MLTGKIYLSPFLLVVTVCFSLLFPTAAFADYGETFLFVNCSPGKGIFEVQPVIIWNEDLDALTPAVERGQGIVKKDGYQLFQVESNPDIRAACNLGKANLKVSVSRQNGNKLELFENDKLIASPSIKSVWSFWGYIFKTRYTISSGWEEICGREESLNVWKELDRKRTDTDCIKSSEKDQAESKGEKLPTVAEILLKDGTLRFPPMVYKTLASKGDVCEVALNHLNRIFLGKVSNLRNLLNLRNGAGTLTLPERTLGKYAIPSIFDFDNDGVKDTVFHYLGEGSYLDGNIIYVNFERKEKELTVSDVKVFPCQFDPSVSESSSCPTISQKADEAGIKVTFDNGLSTFFRGRYTGMTPFRYKNKTYIILNSHSDATKLYAAVIYPYEKIKYRSVCLFRRQP